MLRPLDRASFVRALAGLAVATGLAASPVAAEPPRPIPGAGAWMFVSELPGMPEPVCTARTEGPQANSVLVLNNAGVPILMAARPDWRDLVGRASIGISIDGAPPTPVSGHMVHNLVMVMLADESLLARLRAARTIEWTLPFGNFQANVEGLGAALDSVIACTAEARD